MIGTRHRVQYVQETIVTVENVAVMHLPRIYKVAFDILELQKKALLLPCTNRRMLIMGQAQSAAFNHRGACRQCISLEGTVHGPDAGSTYGLAQGPRGLA